MTDKDIKYLGKYVGEVYENTTQYNLDLLDRKLLYLLTLDTRFSFTTLARLLYTTREVVSYRIKRMREEEIILGFLTLIDERKLGFIAHFLFLKLKAVTKEKELLDYLLSIKAVTSVKNCIGSFDLLIRVTTNTLEEFDSLLESILSKYGDFLEDHLLLNRLKGGYLGHSFLLEKELREELHSHNPREHKGSSFQDDFQKKTDASFSLDAVDSMLLDSLQFDARKSIYELSATTHLSPQTVKLRIQKLIHAGVIASFFPEIACNRFNYQYYELFLYVKNLDEKKFLAFLKQIGYVYWYTKQIGAYNYILTIFAKNTSQFHSILNEIRSNFIDNITSFTSVSVFNQYFYQARIRRE
ncbi:Lrp/AsnC family transcriptional regulator [Candidatus Woesearchaeota archaeon]|nr:Lrp/AsnC family transcriptional regulator [Candidatus Woesearchaeota archaeon]